MYVYLGDIPAGVTFPFFFPAYDSNGASVTISGLATTDIEIYKGTSMTQRSSDNGFALIDTDGIDIDSTTGIHGFSVDFSDNSDSGFYAAGSFYNLVVNAVTIDSQTVRFIYAFRLCAAENTAGTPAVDTTRWNNLATVALPLVPTTAGRTLDVSAGGEAGIDWANVGSPTTSLALTGTTIASTQKVDVETIKTQTVTCAAGVTVYPAVGTTATVKSNHEIVYSTDFATNYNTTQDKWNVNLVDISGSAISLMSAQLGVRVVELASDSITAGVIQDGAIDAATFQAGAINAAAIAADAITDAKVASDVTIASVTGAVGSVTGNVGGNVVGSVGSISGVTFPTNFADLSISASTGRVHVGSWAGLSATTSMLAVKSVADVQSGLATSSALSSVSTEVSSIYTVVSAINGAIGSPSDLGTGSFLANNLVDIAAFIDTEVAAIKAKTDNLPASFPANFASMAITAGGIVQADLQTIKTQTVTCSGGVTVPAATLASTTNITAGTITTVTNLTNAPTAGDFTSTMKTSIGTAVAASAVASVTGNVGGNVVGSVGSVAGAVGSISGVSFPSNFASLGINASGHVSRVTLTDTLTTYTGNTVQTGDAYAALTSAVPDTVPADGSRPTVQQAVRMILQSLIEGGISGTTWTVKKEDGSTTLMTVTLDSATTPTSKTRAS